MKFSLVIVSHEYGDFIDGYWVQNHVGTLESATSRALAISKVNSGQDIAVVDELHSATPGLSYWPNLKRLDNKKTREATLLLHAIQADIK